MLLWRLRAADGELLVCSVLRQQGRYRLLVRQGADTLVDEIHRSIHDASRRAEALRPDTGTADRPKLRAKAR